MAAAPRRTPSSANARYSTAPWATRSRPGYGLQPGRPDHLAGPEAATTADPKVVASPAQAEALLAAVAWIRPELTAFFGCLYYGALRPEEAIALRLADCYLPRRGWGMLTLLRPRPAPPRPGPATAPATNSAASSTGPRERSGPSPSRRPGHDAPPITAAAMAPHPMAGCSPEPAADRSAKQLRPHLARRPHPGPRAPAAATALARRPCDLRHAALSLWLNAGAPPPGRARAGHSITMLLAVYTHCIDGQDHITNRQSSMPSSARHRALCRKASGSANRRYRPDPVRYMSVHGPHLRLARGRLGPPPERAARTPSSSHDRFRSSEDIRTQWPLWRLRTRRTWPTHGPQTQHAVCGTACFHA